MSERILLTPPRLLRQMIDDLRSIAEIPIDQLHAFSERLEQQPGFLSDEDLRDLISESIEDESRRAAPFNAMQHVSPGALPHLLESIRTWRQSSPENVQRIPDESLQALRDKLPVFIRDYPALNRAKKAKALQSVLGNRLDDLAFICDARPVYNDARDQIEGMIPLMTLKLSYETQTAEPEELEILLTAIQLKDLIGKAQMAQDKLAVLRGRVIEWFPDGCVEGKGSEQNAT